MKRPTYEEYFMEMAQLAATRSTCLRRKVGAVAVKNHHVLATGYNGAPRGVPHCEDVGCMREKLNTPSGERHEICRGVHAEQNLICQAAYHGVCLDGATVFCTNMPCSICAKMLVNAGIGIVWYLDGYPDEMTKDILGGRLVKLTKP
jgi:dCMP deaminase